jgi:hypothetical protein
MRAVAKHVSNRPKAVSLDHLAGTDQDGWRYRETQLLCCLEIYDEIKLRWLPHWKLAGALTA